MCFFENLENTFLHTLKKTLNYSSHALQLHMHVVRIFPGQLKISKKRKHYQSEATKNYGTTSVIRIRFFIASGNNFTDQKAPSMSSVFKILFLGFLDRVTLPYFLLPRLSSIKRNCSKEYLRKYVIAGSLFYCKKFIKNTLLLMLLILSK